MNGKIPRNANRRAVALGVVAGVGAVYVGSLGLSLLGFKSAGVVAGSIAATIQKPITVAGSIFSKCQSVGVLGMSNTTKAAIAATAGGATYIGYRKLYKRKQQVPKPDGKDTSVQKQPQSKQ